MTIAKGINYNTTPLTPANNFFQGISTNHNSLGATPPSMPPDDTPINSHSNILIYPNFISEDDCKFLIDYAQTQNTTDLQVFDPVTSSKTGKNEWETDKNIRDTQ